jgi:hypothetical protein
MAFSSYLLLNIQFLCLNPPEYFNADVSLAIAIAKNTHFAKLLLFLSYYISLECAGAMPRNFRVVPLERRLMTTTPFLSRQ